MLVVINSKGNEAQIWESPARGRQEGWEPMKLEWSGVGVEALR